MAGLDLTEMLKTGIALSNLHETQRRNDIYEQNALTGLMRMELDQQQLQLEKQKMKQAAGMKGLASIEQMIDDPMMTMDTGRRMQLRVAQGHILRGMGVDLPIPDNVEDLMGGAADYENLVTAFVKGNPSQQQEAAIRFAAAFPEKGKKMLDELSEVVQLPDKLQQLRTNIELNQERLEGLKQKNSKLQMVKNLYEERMPRLERIVNLRRDPQFAPHLRKMAGMSREAKLAYLKLHPDFKEAFEGALASEAQPTLSDHNYIVEQVKSRKEAREQLLADGRDSPFWLDKEIGAYARVGDAYKLVDDLVPLSPWDKYSGNTDPLRAYNEDSWKALQRATQDMRIFHDTTGKEMQAITDERLALANQKFEAGQQAKLADMYAYGEYIKAVDRLGDTKAIQQALAAAEKKYPGVPVDPKVFKNPEKTGKLGVEIKMGQSEVDRNLKLIDATQDTIDTAHAIIDRIQKNPSIVGRPGQMGTALAGSAQQLRALAGLDPGGTKFLNTQTRDETEALYEIMVYMQARTMDPTGVLDTKVVEHARDVLGPLDSFTAGPQQMINKLQTVTAQAERKLRGARRHLKGGIPSYLQGEAMEDKPVSEMTEDELLKTIMGQ